MEAGHAVAQDRRYSRVRRVLGRLLRSGTDQAQGRDGERMLP
jgi:hypothetical protein